MQYARAGRAGRPRTVAIGPNGGGGVYPYFLGLARSDWSSGVRELALALLRGACSTVIVEKPSARSLGLGASSGRQSESKLSHSRSCFLRKIEGRVDQRHGKASDTAQSLLVPGNGSGEFPSLDPPITLSFTTTGQNVARFRSIEDSIDVRSSRLSPFSGCRPDLGRAGDRRGRVAWRWPGGRRSSDLGRGPTSGPGSTDA